MGNNSIVRILEFAYSIWILDKLLSRRNEFVLFIFVLCRFFMVLNYGENLIKLIIQQLDLFFLNPKITD
jgi:hypothetical protein